VILFYPAQAQEPIIIMRDKSNPALTNRFRRGGILQGA